MGKVTGFLEIDRRDRKYQPAADRMRHFREFMHSARRGGDARPGGALHGLRHSRTATPAARSTTRSRTGTTSSTAATGTRRSRNLHSTNNFPEFTGRVCPAPCEASCTLNLEDTPVTIKTIECAIVDRAWREGWVEPEPPRREDRQARRRRSAPARRAWPAAQQLARAGHDVHVYEKNAKAGGLLRYGIPDFKMEKHIIDRRVEQMEAEGVTFHYGVHVGVDDAGEQLLDRLRCGGARRRRRKAARPADPRPRSRRRPLRHGLPAAAEPPRRRRAAARQRRSRSSPAASMSWSSAAATPAPTASAPRSARARSRSRSSRSCRSRRRRRTSC